MKRMLPVVLDLIREYGTNDPSELCQHLKISVKKVVIPDMPKGLSLCVFGHNVIYVNKHLDFNAQNVVIATSLAMPSLVMYSTGFWVSMLFLARRVRREWVGKSLKQISLRFF